MIQIGSLTHILLFITSLLFSLIDLLLLLLGVADDAIVGARDHFFIAPCGHILSQPEFGYHHVHAPVHVHELGSQGPAPCTQLARSVRAAVPKDFERDFNFPLFLLYFKDCVMITNV